MNQPDVKTEKKQDREAVHAAAEARIQTFSYEKPADTSKPKAFAPLCESDRLRLVVQVVKEGGDNNLHYHTKADGCWMVLKGRVRFYGPGDKVIGEFGPHEGLLLPGGSRYWFEKTGEEDLEILQIFGFEEGSQNSKRINVEALKAWAADIPRMNVWEE